MLIRVPDRRVKSEAQHTVISTLASLDIVGFTLFAPAASMFLLALQWGGTVYIWNSATIIGLFIGSAGTLVLFVAWEHRMGDKAMIPPAMVQKRVVWSSCLTLFFFFASLLMTSYYLPIYFQAVRNATPTLSGVYMLPAVLSQMAASIISGILGMSFFPRHFTTSHLSHSLHQANANNK